MVLIMIYVYNLLQGKSLFPSPCGDYGSYRLIHKPFPFHPLPVSVPLRGLWFLSDQTVWDVARPIAEFPSPCGDYGSYPHPL